MPRLDISELYATHREPLLVFFVRRTADVQIAVDLWSETFAQAVASQRRYRGSTEEEATAWLYTIARRQLTRYYRKGAAERGALRRLGVERPEAGPELEAEIVRLSGLQDIRRELREAVAALSAETREAVQLRVLDELSYPEVAERLDISEQAARARVSRGLRTLGDLLDRTAALEAMR